MEQRTSALARILAALALVTAVLVLALVISSSNGGDSSNGSHRNGQHAGREEGRHRTKAKSYVVKTGDTLISIAHRTGVPVAEILALNPEVDPQILIAGQTLKLR
jgi:hypothetical protein